MTLTVPLQMNIMSRLNRTPIKYHFLIPGQESAVQGQLPIVSSGVTYYFNSQHLLYQLGKDARCFYDYLCERMNNQNNVTINAELKSSFVAHLSRLTSGKKNLPVSSLPTYVSKMNSLGLLLLIGNQRSAYYCVNPKYAFKGTKSQRNKLVSQLIDFRGRNGLSLHGLINSSEDDFLTPQL